MRGLMAVLLLAALTMLAGHPVAAFVQPMSQARSESSMCCTWGFDDGSEQPSQGGSAQGGQSAAVTSWVIGTPGGGVRPPSGSGVTCTAWLPAASIDPTTQPSDAGGFKVDPDGVVAVLYFRDCGDIRQVVWVRQEPPAVIARVALRDIQTRLLAQPEVALSPPDRGIVNLETWLSAVDAGPHSARASIPGRSVTVTAQVASTRWTLDDGTGEPVTITCDGVGSPWTPADGERPAPCGHTWQARSPQGSSPTVSAWLVWDVTWAASNGTTGALEQIESAPAVVPYRIDEIQTIGTRG